MTNNSPMPDALTVAFPRLLSEIPEAQRAYRLITFDAIPWANEITTQFIIDGEVSAESDEPADDEAITEIIEVEPASSDESTTPHVVHLMDDNLLDACGVADRDANLHVTPVTEDVTCEPCRKIAILLETLPDDPAVDFSDEIGEAVDEQVDLALDEPIPGDETITQFIDVPPSIALLLPSEAPRGHRGRRRAKSDFPYAMALLALAGIACLAYGVVVQVSQLAVTAPLLAAVSLPALVFSGVCLTLAILQKR